MPFLCYTMYELEKRTTMNEKTNRDSIASSSTESTESTLSDSSANSFTSATAPKKSTWSMSRFFRTFLQKLSRSVAFISSPTYRKQQQETKEQQQQAAKDTAAERYAEIVMDQDFIDAKNITAILGKHITYEETKNQLETYIENEGSQSLKNSWNDASFSISPVRSDQDIIDKFKREPSLQELFKKFQTQKSELKELYSPENQHTIFEKLKQTHKDTVRTATNAVQDTEKNIADLHQNITGQRLPENLELGEKKHLTHQATEKKLITIEDAVRKIRPRDNWLHQAQKDRSRREIERYEQATTGNDLHYMLNHRYQKCVHHAQKYHTEMDKSKIPNNLAGIHNQSFQINHSILKELSSKLEKANQLTSSHRDKINHTDTLQTEIQARKNPNTNRN